METISAIVILPVIAVLSGAYMAHIIRQKRLWREVWSLPEYREDDAHRLQTALQREGVRCRLRHRTTPVGEYVEVPQRKVSVQVHEADLDTALDIRSHVEASMEPGDQEPDVTEATRTSA